jgi:antitoxin VapB
MAMNIRNTETEKLAQAIVALTGETKTEAVTTALKERLEHLKRRRRRKRLADELDEIARHCASLPLRDRRTDDEIIGYDENGMPA